MIKHYVPRGASPNRVHRVERRSMRLHGTSCARIRLVRSSQPAYLSPCQIAEQHCGSQGWPALSFSSRRKKGGPMRIRKTPLLVRGYFNRGGRGPRLTMARPSLRFPQPTCLLFRPNYNAPFPRQTYIVRSSRQCNFSPKLLYTTLRSF